MPTLPVGGPIGSVIGAAAGGLAGAVAGGTVASQRGPEGAAIDMSKVPANAGEAVLEAGWQILQPC
jgi:outer membrane lipoprotein SlyB